MNKHRIGLIGGAGASAGSLLFDKMIEFFQKKYKCTMDNEFPFTLLLNYPFSDMLGDEKNEASISKELVEAFDLFEQNKITIAAISCNTLHAYLPKLPEGLLFVHMIEETRKHVISESLETPLVICTTTSSKNKLHQKYFSCDYVSNELQVTLDKMIADITLGADLEPISNHLSRLLPDRPILLGCTEFSYLNEKFPLKVNHIIDPNAIVAEKIAELFFGNN